MGQALHGIRATFPYWTREMGLTSSVCCLLIETACMAATLCKLAVCSPACGGHKLKSIDLQAGCPLQGRELLSTCRHSNRPRQSRAENQHASLGGGSRPGCCAAGHGCS